MPAPRQISMIQITVMLTYIEKYKIGISPAGKCKVERMKEQEHWIKLTKLLNKCPGVVRDVRKWREFWNDLKYLSRFKSAKGKRLLNHEKKALRICGVISNKPLLTKVNPDENTQAEATNESGNYHLETQEDDETTMEQEEQSITTEIIPSHAFDPMSSDVILDTFIQDNPEEEVTTEHIEEPIIKEEYTNTSHQEVDETGDVPDWVRRVEHSRLSFESRTTEAIEKMSEGITSMAGAMKSIAGSLSRIEKALSRSNINKKCDCQNT